MAAHPAGVVRAPPASQPRIERTVPRRRTHEPGSRNDIDYSSRGLVADLAATFGGVLLIIASAFDVLPGASAIANDDLYSAGSEYLYKLNMTTWGASTSSIGVVGDRRRRRDPDAAGWGLVLGMIVAGLSMLTNFAFLPHYPFWSIIIIAFNALVIWALSVQVRGYGAT